MRIAKGRTATYHSMRYTLNVFIFSPAEALVTLAAVTGVTVVKQGSIALGKGD